MPTTLDYYLLALIARGASTQYAMLKEGGISLGASTPSLRRLVNQGFVTVVRKVTSAMTTSKSRQRKDYELTREGKRVLKGGMKRLLEAPIPHDLDSVLRICTFLKAADSGRTSVTEYLSRAASARTQLASAYKAQAEAKLRTDGDMVRQSLPWMRLVCATYSAEAEGKAFSYLAALIQQRK